MADAKQSYSTDPALYIYTSLTAGSSHIVTATSRLETILRANRVPFKAIDIATDQKARMLWGRRAGKDEGGRMRKLPGLVQMGMVLGDLVEIEDWNEYGELKQHVKIYYDDFTIPPKGQAPIANPLKSLQHAKPAANSSTAASTPKPAPAAPPLPEKKESESTSAGEKRSVAGGVKNVAASAAAPIKSIAEEAAQKAKQVHLNSLREKVYGKKDATTAANTSSSSKQAETKDSTGTAAKTPADTDAVGAPMPATEENGDVETDIVTATKAASDLKISPPPALPAVGSTGLQSPTTGAWKASGSLAAAAAESRDDSHLRQVLQSPTSGTWKDGDVLSVTALPIREHRGSKISSASAEEIKALEQAEAIPEGEEDDSSEEEDDEDDEEEDDDDEEEEEDKEKKS